MTVSISQVSNNVGTPRERRAPVRSALLLMSMACIVIPLPLIGVMGYLVADGKLAAAYCTALAAVSFCVCAIAAYLARRVI